MGPQALGAKGPGDYSLRLVSGPILLVNISLKLVVFGLGQGIFGPCGGAHMPREINLLIGLKEGIPIVKSIYLPR